MFLACSAGDGSSFGKGNENQAAVGGSGGGSGDGGDGFTPTTSGGPDGDVCATGPGQDYDLDGYSYEDDCNDCDGNVNPEAIEVGTDPTDPEAVPSDENCDGEIDELQPPCDDTLALDDADPMNAARALNLCHQQSVDGFGVVSATYVRANGTPTTPGLQAGIIGTFGPNVPPRHGGRLLAMSSGHARTSSQPGACGTNSCTNTGAGTAPAGFPANVPGCSGSPNINDDVGLEVVLQPPSNANGFSYEFNFYSFEFPEWVCTSFNDQYIALVTPPPMGSINGNISFDSMSNPVSVNIAFFDVCTYDPGYPQFPCSLGPTELAGTGFDVWDDAGATSWLVSTAPIDPTAPVTIRFALWDTGDSAWDSTVLIDNFQWIASAGTITVDTIPVPE